MLSLFFIESKRQWIIFRRYPVEAFAGVIVFTVIFLGMFLGSKYLAGGSVTFGTKLDVVVAGYVVWLVTTGLFVGPGAQLTEDARTGILEQLFMSQRNFAFFTGVRALGGLAQHLLLISVVLSVICLLTGARLGLRFGELIPFLGVILASTGLGLMVASYAMMVKQINSILGIGQFLLLALVVTPIASLGEWGPVLSAITPINPSSQLLQAQLATGHEATVLELLVSAGNGLLYLLFGMRLLNLAGAVAKRRGTIGSF